MRIVLDTNILVRANGRATGPARELLLLIVRSPGHTLPLSPFLLNELERVFSYDRVRRVTRLNEDEVWRVFRVPPGEGGLRDGLSRAGAAGSRVGPG